MKKNFLICGFIGWCLEILWTGLHSILAGELTMTGPDLSFNVSHLWLCHNYPSCFSQTFQSVHSLSAAVSTQWGFFS